MTQRRPFSFVARRLLPMLAIACLIAIGALVLTGVHPGFAPAAPPPPCLSASGVTIALAADGVQRVTSLRADGPAARAGLHVGDGVTIDRRMRIVRFHREP